MKIEAKIEISKVDMWGVNWDNEAEKNEELRQLKYKMKMAIFERCGVNLSDISIELSVVGIECDHYWHVDMYDNFGFPASNICDKCGKRENV